MVTHRIVPVGETLEKRCDGPGSMLVGFTCEERATDYLRQIAKPMAPRFRSTANFAAMRMRRLTRVAAASVRCSAIMQ